MCDTFRKFTPALDGFGMMLSDISKAWALYTSVFQRVWLPTNVAATILLHIIMLEMPGCQKGPFTQGSDLSLLKWHEAVLLVLRCSKVDSLQFCQGGTDTNATCDRLIPSVQCALPQCCYGFLLEVKLQSIVIKTTRWLKHIPSQNLELLH